MTDRFIVKDTAGNSVEDKDNGFAGFGYCAKGYSQKIVDMLNYADQHMPKPKKTLEDFLAMSDGELNQLAAVAREQHSGDYAVSVRAYYNFLRPELKELGYYIDLSTNGTDPTTFWLFTTADDRVADITESITNTPARNYTILYLLAKELKHDEDEA